MTRAILWKEVREQLAILIALFVMGSAMVIAMAAFKPPSESRRGPFDVRTLSEPSRATLLAMVLVTGMVVGGALFAGEEELGTAKYLLTLPARRARLFVAKVVTGLVLTGVMVSGFILVGWAAGMYAGAPAGVWIGWLGVAGLASFACGVAGSTAAKSTLVACGLGVLFSGLWQVVGLVIVTLAASVFHLQTYDPDGTVLPLIVSPLFTVPTALFQAYLLFTGPDRLRKNTSSARRQELGEVNARRSFRGPRFRLGFRHLFWLTRRQLAKPALILGGFSLAVGLVLLHPDALPSVVWPAMTLLFGALAGVIAFADEQTHGVNRHWSERQLPAGRLWLAKACGAAVLTAGLSILLLLPRAVAEISRSTGGVSIGGLIHTGVLPALHWGFAYYLILGPTYGLAFGLACGMLFQKPVVAAATAMLLAGTTAVLWVPSLFTGGVHYWQILLPPAVVLLTSRFLTRPWANDRIATRRGIRTIIGGSVAALLVLALCIGYRVVEVQESPEGDADLAFAKTIPTYDEKQPGRDLRAAAARFAENYRRMQSEVPERTYGTVDRHVPVGPDAPPQQYYIEQLRVAAALGWPTERPDLDRWLDRLCAGDWIDKALALRGRPPGVFEDPNDMTFAYVYKQSDDARNLTTVLVARGLQLQARGDDAAFVALADASLAAVRTGRNKTTVLPSRIARSWADPVWPGVDSWLKRLDGKPELLRQMLAVLREHEASPPGDPAEIILAEQTLMRNSYKAPQQWVYQLAAFDENASKYHVDEKTGRAEADWLAFAWTVPWEKERLRRVIGRGNGTAHNVTPIQWAVYEIRKLFDSNVGPPGSTADDQRLVDGLPGYYLPSRMGEIVRRTNFGAAELASTAALRMAILKVALRLDQSETGRLPATLDALVPKYLPAVPIDPYDGKPIRYRVSPGETIYGKQTEPTEPPGRGSNITLNRLQFMAVAAVSGGGVCWPRVNLPNWPPGRDVDFQLDADQFEALTAVAGGLVQWRENDGRGYGSPGGVAYSYRFWTTWAADDYQAVAAVSGGAVFLPFARDPWREAPGIIYHKRLSEAQFDAVAAVVGAAVQWPLDMFWKDVPAAGRVRLPNNFGSMREEIWVPTGQAILWSVGPDRIDSHALFLCDGLRGDGDLTELVPFPRQPQAKETPR